MLSSRQFWSRKQFTDTETLQNWAQNRRNTGIATLQNWAQNRRNAGTETLQNWAQNKRNTDTETFQNWAQNRRKTGTNNRTGHRKCGTHVQITELGTEKAEHRYK